MATVVIAPETEQVLALFSGAWFQLRMEEVRNETKNKSKLLCAAAPIFFTGRKWLRQS